MLIENESNLKSNMFKFCLFLVLGEDEELELVVFEMILIVLLNYLDVLDKVFVNNLFVYNICCC